MSALTRLEALPFGASALHFWRWWTDELVALTPRRMAVKPAAEAVIRPSAGAVRVERIASGTGVAFVDERPLEALDDTAWAELAVLLADCRARLILSPPDIHAVRLTLPLAARRRLRSTIELQLGEVAPLVPEALVWTSHNIQGKDEQLSVTIVMARTERIADIMALFAAHDIASPEIFANDGGTHVRLVHLGPSLGLGRLSRPWLIALAAFATIPLSVIGAAWVMTVIDETASAELERAVRPKLIAERRARDAERVRAGLSAIADQPSASALLNGLAASLPPSGYLKTIDRQADGSVTFIVDSAEPDGLANALSGNDLLPDLQVRDRSPVEDARAHVAFAVGRP